MYSLRKGWLFLSSGKELLLFAFVEWSVGQNDGLLDGWIVCLSDGWSVGRLLEKRVNNFQTKTTIGAYSALALVSV